MTRTSLAFADAIGFSRGCAADYVDASGATVSAAANAARFTHDPAAGHALLGLLVEGLAENPAPDLAVPAVYPPAWDASPTRRTILHRWIPAGTSTERRDAHFTDDPKAAFGGLLRQKGIHAQCLSFAFLPTDIDDVLGEPPLLTRDGDAVSVKAGMGGKITRVEGEVWTVQSELLTTAAAEHVLTDTAERIITGADA
jgi:hypothetical protein